MYFAVASNDDARRCHRKLTWIDLSADRVGGECLRNNVGGFRNGRAAMQRGPAGPIVPVVNVEPNENMEFAYPPSIPPFGGQGISCVGRRRVGGLQIPSHAPFGEPRATAPTRRSASLGEAA